MQHLNDETHSDAHKSAAQAFFGAGVYGLEGRRVGSVRKARAGRPGGRSYAIVELTSYSRSLDDLRAVPISMLTYDPDRSHYLCRLPELGLRSAPKFTHASEWLDDRWSSRLDAYYDLLDRA